MIWGKKLYVCQDMVETVSKKLRDDGYSVYTLDDVVKVKSPKGMKMYEDAMEAKINVYEQKLEKLVSS